MVGLSIRVAPALRIKAINHLYTCIRITFLSIVNTILYSKTGVYKVKQTFLIFDRKHKLRVLVRTASVGLLFDFLMHVQECTEINHILQCKICPCLLCRY